MPEPLTVVGYVLFSFLFLFVVIQVSGLYDIVKGLRQTFQRDKDVYDEGKKAYDVAIAAKLTTGEAAANQRAAMLAAYLKKYPESTPEQADKAVKDILALNMSTEDLIEFIRVETEYHQAKGNDEEVEKLKKEKQDLLNRVPDGGDTGGGDTGGGGQGPRDLLDEEPPPQGLPLPPPQYPNPTPLPPVPQGDGTFGAACGPGDRPCDDTKGLICDTIQKRCIRVQNVALNGACSENTQCSPSNGRPTKCQDNRCKLIPGTGVEGSFCGEAEDATCLASSFLECNSTTKKCQKIRPGPTGAPCDFLSDCVSTLSCVNGKCGTTPAQAPPPAPPAQVETCSPSSQSGVERVRVTYKSSGSIWGGACGVYTGDSDIDRAATHQGLVTPSNTSRCISKRILPGQTSYPSVILNGITSAGYGSFNYSYKIWDGSEPSCSTTASNIPATAGDGQKCGPGSVGGNVKCGSGLCCSVGSWCGKTGDHCCQGNQADFNGDLAPSCNTARDNDAAGTGTTPAGTGIAADNNNFTQPTSCTKLNNMTTQNQKKCAWVDDGDRCITRFTDECGRDRAAQECTGEGYDFEHTDGPYICKKKLKKLKESCTTNTDCASNNCYNFGNIAGRNIKRCMPLGPVVINCGNDCQISQAGTTCIKNNDQLYRCINVSSGTCTATATKSCWNEIEAYKPPANIKSRYKRL